MCAHRANSPRRFEWDSNERLIRLFKIGQEPVPSEPKKQLTIRLDEDTIDYFRSLAGQSGIPYQSLINLYLRDCVAEKKKLRLEWAS